MNRVCISVERVKGRVLATVEAPWDLPERAWPPLMEALYSAVTNTCSEAETQNPFSSRADAVGEWLQSNGCKVKA